MNKWMEKNGYVISSRLIPILYLERIYFETLSFSFEVECWSLSPEFVKATKFVANKS